MSAHDRLVALWDALEARGAVVDRIALHTITSRSANGLAAAEEHRLRIMAENCAPPPARLEPDAPAIERLVLLVERATRGGA